MDVNGSFPEKLPLPWGWEAAYSPDGARLAYVPMRRAFNVWKRYRGGDTTPIWLATLADSKVEKVPRENSNDYNPLWIGGKVYFLSDRNGAGLAVLLRHADEAGEGRGQEQRGFDFKSIGAGADAIVVEQFGGLALFDLKTGKVKPVPVRIAGDLPGGPRPDGQREQPAQRRAPVAERDARAVRGARRDPHGAGRKRRPADTSRNTPRVMERSPSWSPDGKTIAYFSDESGEYALHLAPQTGIGDVTKIRDARARLLSRAASGRPTRRRSPSSTRTCGSGTSMSSSASRCRSTRSAYWNPFGDDWVPVWSPDSQVAGLLDAAVELPGRDSRLLARLRQGDADHRRHERRRRSGLRQGRQVSCTSRRRPIPVRRCSPTSAASARPVTRSVYLAVLSQDQPSPFAPESDEEKGEAAPPAPTAATTRSREAETRPAPPKADRGARSTSTTSASGFSACRCRRAATSACRSGKPGVLFALETPAAGAGPAAVD